MIYKRNDIKVIYKICSFICIKIKKNVNDYIK